MGFDPNPADLLAVENPESTIQAASHQHYKCRSLQPESESVILAALQKDATARRILSKGETPQFNTAVGVRLNINVLRSTGVAVHSVHKATSKDGHTKGRGFYRGEVTSYLPVVVLRDAFFNVHQGGREGIASGQQAKHPMASIDGTFTEQPEKVGFDGVEVSFNPKRTHLFVDAEGFALRYAEEVTILGHRAYARGRLEFYTAATAPQRAGDAPTVARFK
jgi:hypothetical protein